MTEEGIPICVDYIVENCPGCSRFLTGRYWTKLLLTEPKKGEFAPSDCEQEVLTCPDCGTEYLRVMVWKESEDDYYRRRHGWEPNEVPRTTR